MTKALVGLAASAVLALTAVGCASSSYRIPGAEMQRLAYLNSNARGTLVRVVPPDASTTYLAAVPEAPPVVPLEQPPLTAPTDPDERQAVATDQVYVDERPTFSGDLGIDAAGPPRNGPSAPRRAAPSGVLRGTASPGPRVAPAFSPPVFTPVVRAPPMRAAVAALPRGNMGALTGRSAPSRAPIPAPSVRVGGGHGGGGHSSGGAFSGGDGVVALIAVVAIVGIAVLIAEAASEDPPPFDGWARISPDQPLHPRYRDSERVVKLRELRPTDLVGLRDTVVSDKEGRLQHLPPDADRHTPGFVGAAGAGAAPYP